MSADVDNDTGEERIDNYPETMTRGGGGFGDCSGFKRDIIWAVLRLGGVPGAEGAGEPPHGLAIKEELERSYRTTVNHGRLYPNLDDLVEMGLLDKGELDKRTNSYVVTDRCLEQINQYLDFIKAGTEKGVEIKDRLS